MKTPKKIIALFAFCICLGLVPPLVEGCKRATLAQGGPYTVGITNTTTGEVTWSQDYKLFMADKAFELAYETLNVAFKIEYDNRDALWKASPKIKQNLDKIRVEAVRVKAEWATARANYLAKPQPSSMAALDNILTELNRIAAASSVIFTQNTTPTPAP